MTTRWGTFSESLPEGGTRNGRGAVGLLGTEKAKGNDNTHPFAIVLGKERRMEE